MGLLGMADPSAAAFAQRQRGDDIYNQIRTDEFVGLPAKSPAPY